MAQVLWWHKAFAEGRESFEDEPRSGRPSVSRTDANVDRVWDLVCAIHRLAIRKIGTELNLSYTTIHQILLNEFGMRKICSKQVLEPHAGPNGHEEGLVH